MQKTRTHTCCETSCQAKDESFKGDSKKLPSGKTNFPFAYISTSWTFWRKTRFLGDVPIAVCSLYIFPPICPSSTPPKKIDILRLFPPPEEVHQSTLCRWPRTSTCWHPKPRFFWNHKQRCSTAGSRRIPGKKKYGNFQGRWTSEKRCFFFRCVFVLKVGSYWKKNRETRIHRIHP